MLTQLERYRYKLFSTDDWSWDDEKLEIDNSERWIAVIVDVRGHTARWIPGRKKPLEGTWGPEVRGLSTVKDDYKYRIKVLDIEEEQNKIEFGMMRLGLGCRVTNYTYQFEAKIGDELAFMISEGFIFYFKNSKPIHAEMLKHNPIQYFPTCSAACAACVKILLAHL